MESVAYLNLNLKKHTKCLSKYLVGENVALCGHQPPIKSESPELKLYKLVFALQMDWDRSFHLKRIQQNGALHYSLCIILR